ncbi:MAG: hypothetical protein SWY16_17855 [Cyanobacteriota bacterium]|nr:hypothetical protein [Cyanobacteriota bacterium]
MLPQIQLLPDALSEIVASAADTGVLTKTDRYGLMAVLLEESLDEESLLATNRLIRAVVKGRIKFLD